MTDADAMSAQEELDLVHHAVMDPQEELEIGLHLLVNGKMVPV